MNSKLILSSLLILIASFKHCTPSSLRKEYILSCTYDEKQSSTTLNDIVILSCYDYDVPTNKIFPSQASAYLECANKRKPNGYQAGNIVLRDCQMSRIKYNISTVFTHFHTLNVSAIELQSLPSSFFTGAKSLKTLIASNNRLLEIPPFQFAQCPLLIDVDISHNKISRVDGDAFAGVSGTMKKLNFSHNHLTDLHPNFFTKLATLEIIDLSHNYIEHLVPFANLSKLVHLNLSFNSIKDLSDTMILSQPNLRFLQLSHNNFTLLKIETFAKQSRLHFLDLSYNSIRRLDFNSTRMDHLEQFHINDNQLADLDGFKNLIFPVLNSFAITGNQFNCSYLKTFLDSFDYHSSLSVLHHTNSTNPKDGEEDATLQVHGVGCYNVSNSPPLSTLPVVESTTESANNSHADKATTEPDAQYNATVSPYNLPPQTTNNGSHLLIVMGVLVAVNVTVMIFMIVRNSRKSTSHTDYNGAYKPEIGTKFSNVTVENEYETIQLGGGMKRYDDLVDG